jgi:hypothetical protein
MGVVRAADVVVVVVVAVVVSLLAIWTTNAMTVHTHKIPCQLYIMITSTLVKVIPLSLCNSMNIIFSLQAQEYVHYAYINWHVFMIFFIPITFHNEKYRSRKFGAGKHYSSIYILVFHVMYCLVMDFIIGRNM